MDGNKVVQTIAENAESAAILANLATKLGLPDQAADAIKYAATIAVIAKVVKERIDDGKIVITGDPEKAKQVLEAVARQNDSLAETIANG